MDNGVDIQQISFKSIFTRYIFAVKTLTEWSIHA